MAVHPYTRLFSGKTTAPTINDDVSLGYEVGDVWIDETANVSYVCVDNTDGAAVWNTGSGDPNAVSSAGSSVAGNIATFFDATGLIIQDSLVSLSMLVQDFCEGRLTLLSGTPAPTADQTGKTTIYFAPYKGNRISLYDAGTTMKWYAYTFTERSIAVPATTNTAYDVFIYITAGTITLELVAWTNVTTRATALALQDGILVKSGDASRRYLGTFVTTGVSGQTEDSRTKRLLWNYYNRVKKSLHFTAPDSSWTYTSTSWRVRNANNGSVVELVTGWLEDEVSLKLVSSLTASTTSIYGSVSIGEDSTTTPHADSHRQGGGGGATSDWFQLISTLDAFPASVGYHYYSWLERGPASGTITFYGGTGADYWRGGMNGSWFC